ncbi:MAG TPA: CvpA family protein [Fibrobacteria bacterium]|nr:CvpA family protein [Fibrobacteria bacterium]HOX53791.1 CvpA family protein [Fibrobacteria bacterium]
MNWVDFAGLTIVAFPALSGLRHGLVAGLLKFGALVVFVGLAIWQMPFLTTWSSLHLPLSPSAAPVVAIVLALVVGWIAGALAALAWKKLSEGSVAWTDRLLGCLSGAIKGAFVAVCAMATLAAAWPRGKTAVEESWISRNALAPILEEGRSRLASRLGFTSPESP